MIQRTKQAIRNYIAGLKKKTRNAILIILGALGLTLLITGMQDFLQAYSTLAKIVVGTALLGVAGFWGFGILGHKKHQRKY